MSIQKRQKLEENRRQDFRERQRNAFAEKRAERDLYKSQKVCEQLDAQKVASVVYYFYRPHPKDGGRYCFQIVCQSTPRRGAGGGYPIPGLDRGVPIRGPGGGYPRSRWGLPHPADRGVPHPRSGWGRGTHPRSRQGSTPSQVWMMGVTPGQDWIGYPPPPPPARTGWDTPLTMTGWTTPPPPPSPLDRVA